MPATPTSTPLMSYHQAPNRSMISPFTKLLLLLTLGSLSAQQIANAADHWPQFRGINGDGVANDQSIPINFNESSHVTWKSKVPGRGWSSPVISDGVIWLTTAVEKIPNEEERLALLRDGGIAENKFRQLAIARSIDLKLVSMDMASGSILQTVDLANDVKPDAIHSVNSYASPTPVIDGDKVYCHFGTYGTFCVDRLTGQIAWQRRLPLNHSVGPGSSPFIHGGLLILIQDGMERQYVAALNKKTGKTQWETDRPEMEAPTGDQKKSFCTPIALKDLQGREQLICMGSQWMVSYHPETGKEIWRCYHGKGFSVVPQPVYDHAKEVVYFCTGFGKPQLWAVDVSGSGDVTQSHVKWIAKQGIPAKSSPLLHDDRIYIVADNGIASCLNSDTGDQIWKHRISGDYSASPVMAGGLLYFGSHDGKVTVMQPGDEAKVVAENQLEGKIMATPAIAQNALLLRTESAVYKIE